jgi:cytochrome c biogenesis protein CcdA/thiol-disulfide isomerase/thioredoxin
MLVLVGIAFVAGIVTAISPCVLPVLPIVFAGSATGEARRPYAIVAGLVTSFTAFTLAATALLSALGLPDDLLRNIAIAIVLVVGLSLLWPRLGTLLERPFAALGRRRPGDVGGGFLLGASLGLLFTPCAGPVIAAVSAVAATERFSIGAVFVTLAYALGAGVVLLALAVAARRGFALPSLRSRARVIRPALGGLIVAVGLLMVLELDLRLQTRVPGYTRALQGLEESAAAAEAIDDLVGRERDAVDESTLDDYGLAPEFREVTAWLNSEPLSLDELRGKVVLLDFWTYSCINCLRTLPYLRRWDEAYRDDGLVVVGVHTPEFAFERDQGNVEAAVERLGVRYPVALDNDYGTWNAWANRYWPASYFIDRRGHVRFAHFGEGAYEEKESVIRTLLAEPGLDPPVAGEVQAGSAMGVETPETYLGYERLASYYGGEVVPGREATYTLPESLPPNAVAYGGRWTVEGERIVAGEDARLRLRYRARKVHLVLGTSSGLKTVEVSVDGDRVGSVRVTDDKLYTLASSFHPGDHVLDLSFDPGTEAYAFTFG